MTDDVHIDILPEATRLLMTRMQKLSPAFLSSFYLSGGTALALHLGHRESEDLDFFTDGNFDGTIYQKELESLGPLTDVTVSNDTLNAYITGVKVQLLHYPYTLLEKTSLWNGIRISGTLDIACTKLLTVSQRGSKKDFIDIYFLLQLFPLADLMARLDEKYEGVNYNKMHILKSLVYFSDAESQPMPRMIKLVTWEEVKRSLLVAIKAMSLG